MKTPQFRQERCTRSGGRIAKACAVVLLLILLSPPADGMDRWAALSQIESGDKDDAVGAAGEISRYQIRPEVWRRYASTQADWEDRETSLAVARQIMKERCADFERSFHRQPTDLEFYILWNAPAQIRHPKRSVSARAERFCNLVSGP